MFNRLKQKWIIAGMIWIGLQTGLVWAGDLDDGISEYTDESISSEENMGGKDTNINFIVVDAMAKAKMMNKNKEKDSGDKNNTVANFNDGQKEYNENSVVVESGSRVDKVYNIIIEK